METKQLEVTMGDLIDFILDNRRGNAFKDWTPEQIFTELDQAFKDNCLLFSTDSTTGKVIGVAEGRKLDDCVVMVRNILTTRRGVVGLLLKVFRYQHPHYSVMRAERHKKYQANMTYKHLGRLLHLLSLQH